MSSWTKEQEIALITDLQREYVEELYTKILRNTNADKSLKYLYFTSPTGTGKTKMMSMLINMMPDYYFIVTTLSKGQLYKQIQTSLQQDCVYENFVVYGSSQLTKNSIMSSDDVIKRIPKNASIIWLRDEGHIHTNNWTTFLEERCFKIVDFSATNKYSNGVVCNFTQTMMLRTVNQKAGSVETALDKLMQVKKQHRTIASYNPCALFRVTSTQKGDEIEKICIKRGLKTISLVDNDNYDMSDLCEDDNEYDVIINKQKIVEGIDIRRAHVLWIENEPNNISTTIQLIGRCRRNALLWRDDIDILSPSNEQLLKDTRTCYVFYNVDNMKVQTDENGELAIAFCPYISVEKLRAGHTISVENGWMKNGLYVTELSGCTGDYEIKVDKETGFNYVDNQRFYDDKVGSSNTRNQLYFEALCELLNQPDDYWKRLYESLQKLSHHNHICFNALTYEHGTIVQYSAEKIVKLNGDISFHPTNKASASSYIEREKRNCVTNLLDKDSVCLENADQDMLLLELENNSIRMRIEDVYRLAKKKYDHQQISANFILKIFRNNSVSLLDTSQLSVTNNRMLALVGNDDFHAINIKDNIEWRPERTVTSKLAHDTKLSRFIENEFAAELIEATPQLFTGTNKFNFDPKCNACLGYCVEYYAKYLAIGPSYLAEFIDEAEREYKKISNINGISKNNVVIVRACMLKYRELMAFTYGQRLRQLVKSISVEQLITSKLSDFVRTVVSLGTKAASFITSNCNVEEIKTINHSFITDHIVGLADVISKDTIIDIKCTSNINLGMIKQVLTYYWLSTFRLDLNIRRVIVYDAVTGKSVKIDIEQKSHDLINSVKKQLSKPVYCDPEYKKIERIFERFLYDTYKIEEPKMKVMLFEKDNLTFYHIDILKTLYGCNNENQAIRDFLKKPDLLTRKTNEWRAAFGAGAVQLLYCLPGGDNSIYYKEKRKSN